MGDGLLAEFGSVIDAVECAVSLQRGMAERNAAVPEEERFDVRIGINIGELIVDGEDRYGEGVNVAARLEELALPGGICVSGKVAKEVEKKLAFGFDPAGRQKVKNIEEPIDVYHVRLDAQPRRRFLRRRGSGRLWWALGVPAAIMVAVGAAWVALYGPLTTSPGVSSTIPSVAVLPFKDLSADKNLGYLGEGVANYVRGATYIVLGRNEDAVEVLKAAEFADAPLLLAIAYMRLGREAEARAAVAKMLKTAPTATIQSWRQAWNFRDDAILDQASADLARAGLPPQ